MPDAADPKPSPPDSPTAWFSYAVVRLVPRVERGECLNVGVVVFARTRDFLQARIEVPEDRLRALAPDLDLPLVERHLAIFHAICAGDPAGGPVAALPPSDRFHWLTAPRSTIIQTSPVHVGRCVDPSAALDDLFAALAQVPPPVRVSREPAAGY